MTIEEAIKVLRTESVEIGGNAVSVTRWLMALDMAVKALDAVPVVRCSECKLHESSAFYPDMLFCVEHGIYVDPNGYCYLGERKEGADNG